MEQHIPVDGNWKFRAGDDIAWAGSAYNDASWICFRALFYLYEVLSSV